MSSITLDQANRFVTAALERARELALKPLSVAEHCVGAKGALVAQ